jgi:hypothetical protein
MRDSAGAFSTRPCQYAPAPRRVAPLLDEFAVEFLPAEPRAPIAAYDGLQEPPSAKFKPLLI